MSDSYPVGSLSGLKGKTALLDGDSWVYRCGFAAEKTYYLVTPPDNIGASQFDNYKEAKAAMYDGATLWSRKEIEPLANCLQTVKTSLENTLHVLGVKDYRLYLSGRGNFREDIFPDYKANRDGMSKPKYYRDIRDYLVRQWSARLVDGMEADDAVGIDAVSLGSGAVTVAVDKDLDQIPGEHYNWTTGESYTVSSKDGMRFFYEQLLSGDPTDNVPGLTGIGPKRARAAIEGCGSPREIAQAVYDKYKEALGVTPDEIIDRNARLLWIWRKPKDQHPFWRHLGRERT